MLLLLLLEKLQNGGAVQAAVGLWLDGDLLLSPSFALKQIHLCAAIMI